MNKILLTLSLTIASMLLLADIEALGIIFSGLVYLFFPATALITILILLISIIRMYKMAIVISVILLIFKAMLLYPLIAIGNPLDVADKMISVTNFNASFLKLPTVFSPGYWSNQLSYDSRNIEQYLRSMESDVVCVQEFFNDSLNTQYSYLKDFIDHGYDCFFLSEPKHDNGVSRGLLTCSKYPIINEGKILLSKNRYNGMSFVDLDLSIDTLRVVNVHLESMELYFGNQSFINKLTYAIKEWKRTTVTRHEQITTLNEFLSSSIYPTLVVGDFNELVYSYNMKHFDPSLKNSFSQTSNGFGRTLSRSKLPIRIDHQFYTEGIQPVRSTILTDVTGSDHYPLTCDYILRDH